MCPQEDSPSLIHLCPLSAYLAKCWLWPEFNVSLLNTRVIHYKKHNNLVFVRLIRFQPPIKASPGKIMGLATFCCKRPDSEYFQLCGPCGLLFQLLTSATKGQKQPQTRHKLIGVAIVPIKLYKVKQPAGFSPPPLGTE